jgi:hypothetical protein
MIAVCEPQCSGFAHESFNAGFLLALQKKYPTKKIIFYGEQTHIDAIQYCFIETGHSWTNIEFRPIFLVSIGSNYFDYILNRRFFKKILIELRQRDIKKLILLSVHTTSLIAIKRLRATEFTEFSFSLFLHGVVEYASKPTWHLLGALFYWCIGRPRNWVWLHSFRYAMQFFGNTGMTYVAMSPFAAVRIKKIRAFKKLQIESIHLPIIFNQNSCIFQQETLTLAVIGSRDINNLACFFKKLYALERNNLFVFNMTAYSLPFVNEHFIQAKNKLLTRREINLIMSNVDILILMHGKNTYQHAQSGSFFEFLQYNKPLIALKNEHFEFYNSVAKPFMLSCKSVDDIIQIVEQALNKKNRSLFFSLKENIQELRCVLENESYVHIIN